jgi:hypothetical protein
MKLTTYKDQDIAVDTDGTFSSAGFGLHEKYSDLIAKIDRETKIKYKPIAGIMFNNGGLYYGGTPSGIIGVKITRPHGHGSRKEFWYVREDKQRGTSGALYPDTPQNRNLATQVIEKFSAARELEKQGEAIRAQMNSNIILEEIQ